MKTSKTILLTLFIFAILLSPNVSSASLDQKTIGYKNAPVTIEMFADFECPYCASWHDETYPLIKENYIFSDKAQVKLVVKHFPWQFHEHANDAALAAECAAEQNKFFEYTDILYSHQKYLEHSDLEDHAKKIGLDIAEFNECRNSPEAQRLIERNIAEGEDKGVHGTPSFFINGELISGSYPYETFEKTIEGALENLEDYGYIDEEAKVTLIENSRQNSELDMEIGEQANFNNPDKEDIERINQRLDNLEQELKETKNLLEKLLDFFNNVF